jgi:hypothetical protein
MTPLHTWSLVIGLFLAACVLAKLLSVGAFRITKKQTPYQELRGSLRGPESDEEFDRAVAGVRITPEVLHQMRAEIVHDAVKRGHVVRASFQKGNHQ